MTKFLKELRRRVLETHYRIIEVERIKGGFKWYYVQRLGLFGWTDVGNCCETVEDARNAIKREKNKYVVDVRVVEET